MVLTLLTVCYECNSCLIERTNGPGNRIEPRRVVHQWSCEDLDQEVVARGNTTLSERSTSEDQDIDGHAQGGVGADRVT